MGGRNDRRRLGLAAVAALVVGFGAPLALAVPTAGAAGAVDLFTSPTGSTTACSSSLPCALLTAITSIGTHPGADVTITLAKGTYPAKIYTATTDGLASLTITGAGTSGATASVLPGGRTQQVLLVEGSAPVSLASIELTTGYGATGGCLYDATALTVTHLVATHCVSTTNGAAIFSNDSLHLSTSVIETSTATAGGAGLYLRGSGAVAVITNTTLRKDAAADNGGGVAAVTHAHVSLSGVTLTSDSAGFGGGVAVITSSFATLRTCTLSSNRASLYGGGLWDSTSGTAKVTGCRFDANTAGDTGGGIGLSDNSTLSVSNSTFTSNRAPKGGALFQVNSHPITLTGDTFTSNTATTTDGGAIAVTEASEVLRDDTFADNKAAFGAGGALRITTLGHITATNVTFVTNTAKSGGAVAVDKTATATLNQITFSHNTVTGTGAGLYVSPGTTVSLTNSIISVSDCAIHGSYTDGGHNVASTHTCTTSGTSISTSSTIGLGPLAANTSSGTPTMAITPKSSAFEVVPAAACTASTDQRGFPRPGAPGKSCDAGAYEYQLTGYDLVGSDGGVFVFNPPGVATKGFFGSLPGLKVVPNAPIVGMVPTLTDQGYFLVGSDGGVYAFGNAPFLGSLPGLKVTPAQPITGIVAADTDNGYFLVGRDGGVYAFGTVPFLGSLPGQGIVVSNIIGIAATPSGNGYWLVSATGTVYAFGAAKKLGTAKGTSSPVSAIAGTPTGGGYWITTQNGAVSAFGTAAKLGTLPALHVTPALPVIGIVRVAATAGYWLIGSDGGIFAFGTAPFVGSLPGAGVQVTDIVGAVPN